MGAKVRVKSKNNLAHLHFYTIDLNWESWVKQVSGLDISEKSGVAQRSLIAGTKGTNDISHYRHNDYVILHKAATGGRAD